MGKGSRQYENIWKYLYRIRFSFRTLWMFIKYNFFCGNISKDRKMPFRPLKHSKVLISRSSQIDMQGYFIMGRTIIPNSRLETRLLVERDAKLSINGSFSMYINSYIRIVKGGHLTLNQGFINEGVQITCASGITIGKNCVIARDVVIRDYDAHQIEIEDYQISKPITIKDHVWIGNRAMILKGVTIGEGAIIAAGAIVTKDIPPRCIAAGIPAKVVRENVDWH